MRISGRDPGPADQEERVGEQAGGRGQSSWGGGGAQPSGRRGRALLLGFERANQHLRTSPAHPRSCSDELTFWLSLSWPHCFAVTLRPRVLRMGEAIMEVLRMLISLASLRQAEGAR